MATRQQGRREKGFTLIETLLTLSILAVLLVMVLSALRLGIRAWEKGSATVEYAAARRSLVERLSREVGSLYPYAQSKDGEREYLFKGGPETLGFVTVAKTGGVDPWGGAMLVYYSTEGGGLTVREKTVPLHGGFDEGGRLVELDPSLKISGIRFEYMGGGDWEQSWEADEKKGFPAFIRATISYGGSKKDSVMTLPVGVTTEKEISSAPGPA